RGHQPDPARGDRPPDPEGARGIAAPRAARTDDGSVCAGEAVELLDDHALLAGFPVTVRGQRRGGLMDLDGHGLGGVTLHLHDEAAGLLGPLESLPEVDVALVRALQRLLDSPELCPRLSQRLAQLLDVS